MPDLLNDVIDQTRQRLDELEPLVRERKTLLELLAVIDRERGAQPVEVAPEEPPRQRRRHRGRHPTKALWSACIADARKQRMGIARYMARIGDWSLAEGRSGRERTDWIIKS